MAFHGNFDCLQHDQQRDTRHAAMWRPVAASAKTPPATTAKFTHSSLNHCGRCPCSCCCTPFDYRYHFPFLSLFELSCFRYYARIPSEFAWRDPLAALLRRDADQTKREYVILATSSNFGSSCSSPAEFVQRWSYGRWWHCSVTAPLSSAAGREQWRC